MSIQNNSNRISTNLGLIQNLTTKVNDLSNGIIDYQPQINELSGEIIALTGEVDAHDIDALRSIAHEAGIEIPVVISELFDKEICQKTLINKEDIEQEILAFL